MKLKLKINKELIFVMFILFTYYKFLYLIPLPVSLGYRTNIILSIILTYIYVIFLLIILYKNNLTRKYNYEYSRMLKVFLFVVFLNVIYTILKYVDEPFIGAIKQYFTITILVLYFCICDKVKSNFNDFLNLLITMSTIVVIFFIIQGLLYNLWNIKLLKIVDFSYGNIKIDMSRKYGVRLVATDLVDFVAVISIGLMFSKKFSKATKNKAIINFILTIIYEYFIAQTRSVLLMLLIVFITCFMFADIDKNKKIYVEILCIFIFIFLLGENVYEFILGLYDSSTSGTDWSFVHRFDSVKYYLECFFDNPITGNGLLEDTPNKLKYYKIVHGYSYFSYSYSDVGIVGSLAHYGIIAVLFYIGIIKRTLKMIKYDKIILPLNVAILISIVYSMINLSLIDAERLISLVFLLVVCEANYYDEIIRNAE